MAVGFFCLKNDEDEWVMCHQGSVVTRVPRQLLSVDTYEASTPEQKADYDLALASVKAVYSLVDETLPPEEED